MLSNDKTKRAKIFVCIAIVLMLISMIGASLIQTSGGRVKVDEVNWVDTDGIRKTALLLVPENATLETPAPAIVTSHGFLNNKEMQDLNYVELARRGYVVLAIDMASHGDSQIAPGVGNMMPSVWQGVLFLADIGYVDTTRIGVTGHSFGGFSSNFAVTMDNAAGTNLISAVLVNSMDPTYDSDSDGVFDNVYGSRDVVTNQMFIDNNRDNEELDDVTRAIVAERDRERLKKMTFYCFTNDCLREYILRDFGEYGSGYCGNCSNCKTQFEEMDVTEIAKAIVGCVAECRERYGTTVILDTVHGAATVKIRNYHMDENSHYGESSKVPTYRLRQILNFLQVKEYLVVTSDEYAIVKLGKNAAALLNSDDEKVTMKLPKEQERVKTGKTSGAKKTKMTAGSENFTEEETTLFDLLKELRREIAKEEKVPPYIVFSDKTLVHMCLIKPKNKGEMLKVSGVGEFKFEKYGERFLDKIRDSLS